MPHIRRIYGAEFEPSSFAYTARYSKSKLAERSCCCMDTGQNAFTSRLSELYQVLPGQKIPMVSMELDGGMGGKG